MDGICARSDSYRGKKVEIYGYVHREQELEANQFVMPRSLMSCCLADLQVIGYQDQVSAKILLEKVVKTSKPKGVYLPLLTRKNE